MSGDDGNDRLTGGSDSDDMYGGQGNDSLAGGGATDWLNGGQGNDLVSGGDGSDRFYYGLNQEQSDGGGRDLVRDFSRGSDGLGISFYNAVTSITGTNAFDYLDSNDNRVLDNGDAFVTVGSVTDQGSTRTSTTLELGRAWNALPLSPSGLYSASDALVLFGTTGLTEDDFLSYY